MSSEKFIIFTPRLIIREVCTADEEYIYHAASCPQINLMHSNEFSEILNVRNFVKVLIQEYSKEKYRTLAIADKQSDRVLGMITLDVDKFFPRAEISYWIDKLNRNRGYATEAVETVIKYGFLMQGLNRIQAMHFVENPASGRVLEKSGMLYEGTLRQYVGFNNIFYDCKMYSIIKCDYIKTLAK